MQAAHGGVPLSWRHLLRMRRHLLHAMGALRLMTGLSGVVDEGPGPGPLPGRVPASDLDPPGATAE
jgi:hypothetical protein